MLTSANNVVASSSCHLGLIDSCLHLSLEEDERGRKKLGEASCSKLEEQDGVEVVHRLRAVHLRSFGEV